MTDFNRAPEWVRDAIFYQIMVDRFDNSTADNDDKNALTWGSAPTLDSWMGGDLNGIRKRWDYLTDLGVTALYLTPIFTCKSYHGYDTLNYYKVDPRFGTNEDLKSLVSEAHERGIRVMLDGVFNHVDRGFFAFKDMLKNQEKSKYRDWFHIEEFPVAVKRGQDHYAHWAGMASMPKLNVLNPETQAYLLEVARYWIREADIDGWRLDAAMEMEHDFIKAFRSAVREVKRDLYIMGEVWTEAQPYLGGDECDGTMNYPLRGMILDFVANNTKLPSDMDASLCHIIETYPLYTADAMLNFLSSHDIERLHDRCGGDPLKVGQSVLLQMTFLGAPCLYYGDEISLDGGKDPENRKVILWDNSGWNIGLRDFYKRLIWLRREKDCFRLGTYKSVLVSDEQKLFGYAKIAEDTQALVLFNVSDEAQTAELSLEEVGQQPYEDWLDTGVKVWAENDLLKVKIPAHGMALLGRG